MDQLPNKNHDNPFDAPTDISQLNLLEILESAVPIQEIASEFKVKPVVKKSFKFPKVPQLGKISLLLVLVIGFLFLALKDVPKTVTQKSSQNEDILTPLTQTKPGYEVFGFAPHWTFNRLDNVDFETLTTLAYFGIEAKADGNLDKSSRGYEVFMSNEATGVFKKAHKNGTRVVLTITQMNNDNIRSIMDDPAVQENLINQTVAMVKERGIDGVNIDFEYVGNPGTDYQNKFTIFSKNLTDRVHQEIPNSRVTASVYASAVKDPKIYKIKDLSSVVDGIFMMAYDFAVAGSKNAIPTSPLYGYKEGKYWYDVSTAVDHFLAQMPAEKLILGVPWYGYNYAVQNPEVKTATTTGYYTTYKKGRRIYKQFVPLRSFAQTYNLAKNNLSPNTPGISNYQEGFDEYGKVSWKAYYDTATSAWRMVFIDDSKSLSYKYDFVKEKKLAGVGMWALGFDDGSGDVWSLLKDKFGVKQMAVNSIVEREIK